MESYLVWRRWSERVLEGTPLDDERKRKARFALSLWADAVAPTNVPWLNPAVVKEAIDTGGLSTARGAATSSTTRFATAACRAWSTAPRSASVTSWRRRPAASSSATSCSSCSPTSRRPSRCTPSRCSTCPSWINKYYVLDLAPGRSFIEHAVGKGFTVFAMSYRNPDASLAEKNLDDYMRDGVLTAIDRVAG